MYSRRNFLLGTAALISLGRKAFADAVATIQAPFVQHIPAKTPHTFINSGPQAIKNTAIFSSRVFEAKILGPNPLISQKG
jgi:hypothetical protein